MTGRRWLWWSLGLGVPGLIAGGAVWLLGWPEPELAPCAILDGGFPPAPRRSEPGRLRVLTYNIHFGVGPTDDYDARVPKAQIEENLARIGERIRSLDVDVAFLQEVDFDSARTYGLNEMEIIAAASGLPVMVPTLTWDLGYLPWPPGAHYGRMRSGQAILSRFPVTEAVRLRLPKPEANSFAYNLFYLHRTVQHARLRFEGRTLDLFNVHTEAFDRPNRQIHAERIRDFVRERGGSEIVMGGDFNAVPPEATNRTDFPDEPECDMSEDRSVATMRELGLSEALQSVGPSDEARTFTFPASRPNRRLDYLYFSPAFRIMEGRVETEEAARSDHCPVWVDLAGEPAGPPPTRETHD